MGENCFYNSLSLTLFQNKYVLMIKVLKEIMKTFQIKSQLQCPKYDPKTEEKKSKKF